MRAAVWLLCAILSAFAAGQVGAAQTPTRTATAPATSTTLRTESWLSIFPIGEQVYGLYEDVKNAETLYACTHRGLFRAPDGGLTWALMYATDASLLTLAQNSTSPDVM